MAQRKKPVSAADPSASIRIAEKVTGHRFADRALVVRALTHPSAVESRDESVYYERLEFLGDSVLGFLVAEEVFRRYPEMDEGGMTRIKVSVVNGTVLAAVSAELGLADAIIVGESERGTGGRGLSRALENVYESLVAALYLDAGIDTTRAWVLKTLGPRVDERTAAEPENPKSKLQEMTQADGVAPVYRLLGHEGPPHDRTFTSSVEVAGKVVGEGSGRSKKEAEAAAAEAALKRLERAAKRRAQRRK